jgi:hypothetical protein
MGIVATLLSLEFGRWSPFPSLGGGVMAEERV